MRGLSKVGIALVELFKTVEKVATRYQEMAISDSCFRTGRPSGYTLITMLISREEILAEIRKFVAANDGAIPGERTFLAATRIKESAWKGKTLGSMDRRRPRSRLRHQFFESENPR